jgi:hypothetical protein
LIPLPIAQGVANCATVVYYLILWEIKLSISLFYLRFGMLSSFIPCILPLTDLHLLGVERWFRLSCWFLIGLISVFTGISIIVVLAQCIPLEKLWDFTGTVKGQCVDTTIFFYCKRPHSSSPRGPRVVICRSSSLTGHPHTHRYRLDLAPHQNASPNTTPP